jgi:uncharacterized protein involved in type VI secretion and phage assembly
MSPDESIAGVALAIVRDNQDKSGLGRVRVSFPWHSLPDQTYWARVTTPLAGRNHGFYFTPEIDDEVLVAFDHGDLQSPYVVGSLWNSSNRPPVRNTGVSSQVRLQLTDGKRLTLDQNGIEVADAHGNTISIEQGSGAITIHAAGSLALKAAQISIESAGTLVLKSSATLTLQGAMVRIN